MKFNTIQMYKAKQDKYKNYNRTDITVKGNDPLGKYFAPTWDIVTKYKKSLIDEKQYMDIYHQQILNSYFDNYEKWAELLSMDKVILMCYCPKDAFCHRFLLAEYLTKLGAEYLSELD